MSLSSLHLFRVNWLLSVIERMSLNNETTYIECKAAMEVYKEAVMSKIKLKCLLSVLCLMTVYILIGMMIRARMKKQSTKNKKMKKMKKHSTKNKKQPKDIDPTFDTIDYEESFVQSTVLEIDKTEDHGGN